MAKKTTHLDDAKIDSDVFTAYTKEILGHMKASHKLKDAAKEADALAKDAIKTYAETSGLDVKELAAYMKARFEESLPKDEDAKVVGTGVVINRGNLFTVLNSHLDLGAT